MRIEFLGRASIDNVLMTYYTSQFFLAATVLKRLHKFPSPMHLSVLCRILAMFSTRLV